MGMMRKTVGERGEIVAVEGGHIVRSTGRKDRHSKVYTSKGPRDRRVRLAAHTAIQFYDVQDRLGYDRPSKAVDWLIKKAKSAIDKLDELPPFYPNVVGSTDIGIEPQQQSDDSYFPTNSSNLSLNFENFPHHMVPHSDKSQDLCLSLQSYQDQDRNIGNVNPTEQTLFGAGWDDSSQNEVNRFSRMMGWNNGGEEGENRGGFSFNSLGLAHNHQHLISSTSQIGSEFSQRGTLQSSFVAPVRAWDDHEMPEIHRGSIAGDRYVSEGFSMFGIPTRFHGNEEDDDPSSVSPNSHQ